MHPRLPGLFIGLAVLSLVFRVLEGRWPQGRGRGTDVAYWFFTPLVTQAVNRVGLIPFVALWALAKGVELSPSAIKTAVASGWMAQKPLWVQIPAGLVMADLVGYWAHRFFHGPLWRFHSIHHSSETLDWLASLRLHPVNDFLTRLAQAVPVLLLGFNPEVLAFLLPFLAFHGLLLHSTVGWDFGAVGKVVSSPAFHRWHHTSEEEGLNRNFGGILVVWDRLFGTYYMSQGRRASRFGVLGEPVPDGLWAQLKYPFSA